MMVKNDRKAALHTDAVDKAVKSHERNVVLDGRPPPISSSEKKLTKKERSTLAQLRSGYCRLLGSYKSRIKKDASLNVYTDCGTTPHDVKHLFIFPAHPTIMISTDGRCPETQLSRGEIPRLKLRWTERRTTIDYCTTDEHSQTTRKPTGHNLLRTQSSLSLRPQYPPTHTLPIES